MTENIIHDEIIEIPRMPLKTGKASSFDVSHDGKSNHKIFVSMEIINNENLEKKLDFYLLTPDQFDEWVIPNGSTTASNSRKILPKKFHTAIKRQHKIENYEFLITKSNRIYFVVEKGTYTPSKVSIHVLVKEKFTPEKNKPQVYTSLSVTQNSLSKKIKEIINSSTISLKLISPYTDLHIIEEISLALERGVNVMLITQDQKNLEKTHPTRTAIPHLSQILKKNLKTNDRIHTRLIICDEKSVLLMTADLEQNSMQNLVNCGLLITDTSAVGQISNFFNSVWINSKNFS